MDGVGNDRLRLASVGTVNRQSIVTGKRTRITSNNEGRPLTNIRDPVADAFEVVRRPE